MDRRFDTRLSDMLAQAQVPPDLIDGLLARLETFVLPFAASLREPEHTASHGRVPHGTALEARAQDRRRDRLPARSGTTGPPEVHRAGPVGPSAPAGDARAAGRRRPGRSGRRDRVRSLGLRQEGDQVGGRGAAVVRPARQGRELPGGHLHGVRLAKRTCDRQYAPLSPRGMDEGPSRGRAAGVPETIKFRTRHELALEMLDEHCRAVAARLGGGRRRDGPSREISPGIERPRRTVSAGGPLEHIGPRQRRAAAGILGTREASQESVRARGSLVCRAAGGRVDDDRGPRRREGATDGGRREAPGSGADADRRDGPGGGAVHHAGTSGGRDVQAGLLPFQRRSGRAA